jgi:predicted ribosomally synthesized peptide with SipW-like signal peptide
MRKILVGLMTIALVGAMINGGIHASFSDTETTAGNTFTAGGLNLKVGDNDPVTASIAVLNIKPTDNGSAANWLTKNIGTINGNLSIGISSITNYENVLTEPESAAGDTTANVTEGELGSLLKVAIWLDADESATWNSGDIALKSDGATLTSTGVEALPYDYLDNYSNDSYSSVIAMTTDDSAPGGTDEHQFMVDYEFPEDANDDQAQSDSATFAITFTLVQS